MPTFRITAPDGRTFDVTGPEGSTAEQALAQVQSAQGKKKEAPPIAGGVDPSGSFLENAAAGLGKAVVDTGRGIRGLTAPLLDKIAPRAPGLSDLVTGRDPSRAAEVAAEVAESRRLDAPLMNTGGGLTGNIGGQILSAVAPGGALAGLGKLASIAGAARTGNALAGLGTAAMAPTTIKGAAALGGVAGAMQPALDMGDRAQNVGLGALGGGGGQAAFKGLARVVKPNTSANALAMLDEGITPTPGQLLGGGFKRVEEGLSSVPMVGQSIKNAQARGINDLNRAAINRALKPIGETLPEGMVGREAIEHTQAALGKKYDDLLPKLHTELDGKFIDDVQSLREMMGSGAIDPAMAQRFESILQSQVLQKIPKDGPAAFTGQTMKGIESDLGQMAAKLRSAPDPDQRMLGDAILEVQSILRKNVERSNPDFADELKAINTGYANFKRVQRAAAGVGAEEGVFTAAQLQSAVKALDKSKDKGNFAKGNALMQDLSDPAKAVLAPKVPDSGTPFRLASMAGAGGVAGGALGGLISPGGVAAALAAPVLYSRPGQNALAALMARRPAGAEQTANALRRLGPYAAIPAIGTSTQQR